MVAALEVGRDLEEDWRAAGRARLVDRREQFDQLAARLQIAQARACWAS